MNKIYGTIYGKNIKFRGYIICGFSDVETLLETDDYLNELSKVYDENDKCYDKNELKLCFVADKLIMNPKITLKELYSKSDRVKVNVRHYRKFDKRLVPVGRLKNEIIYKHEPYLLNNGGSSEIYIKLSNGKEYSIGSVCSKNDQFNFKIGWMTAINRLTDEQVKEIQEHLN